MTPPSRRRARIRWGWRGNSAGWLGKQDNCQVAVSVSLANEQASLPVVYRPYLPTEWTQDPTRRHKAGVPAEVQFATETAIAPDQLRALLAAGETESGPDDDYLQPL